MGKSAFVLAALLSTAMSAAAAADQLTIATFGGGLTDAEKIAYWEPFTQKTGVKIIQDTTDDSIGGLRALAATPTAKWDVVEISTPTAILACQEGILHQLDTDKLPMADMLPGSVNECDISSHLLGSVLVYNVEKYGDTGPKTWAEFWDVKRFPGKRVMSRYIQNLAPVVLVADGVAIDKVNEELQKDGALQRILKKLSEIKSEITFVATGTELVQGLVSGAYDLGFGWNARINQANAETNNRFQMLWSAGYVVGSNSFVIPANAANPDLAMDYLSFVTEPAQQAKFMENFDYSAPNTKAYDLLAEDVRQRMPTEPGRIKDMVNEDPVFWGNNVDEWQSALEAWIASN